MTPLLYWEKLYLWIHLPVLSVAAQNTFASAGIFVVSVDDFAASKFPVTMYDALLSQYSHIWHYERQRYAAVGSASGTKPMQTPPSRRQCQMQYFEESIKGAIDNARLKKPDISALNPLDGSPRETSQMKLP